MQNSPIKNMNLPQSDTEQAIKQLFEELFHQLVLSSFHYVNDYDQAEDIVQDVFVKVWQNYELVRQVKDLKGYLFKAVRNSSINFLRHIKVRQKFIIDSEDYRSTTEQSHEEKISEEETKDRVNKAVNELPDKWKEAFILSKYDKFKYHETKALQFLRKELKDILMLGFFIMKFLFDKYF